MKFYRYEERYYTSLGGDGDYSFPGIPILKLELNEFNLYKETPGGYWIGYGEIAPGKLRGHARWVSKYSIKRYAHPTKEEALHSFIKRKEKQISILEDALSDAKMALLSAKAIKL